jgi:hypothetical protein
MTNTKRTKTPWPCSCGRLCAGRAGLATHARSCPTEQARSAAFVAAIESGDWTAYEAAWGTK